MNLRLLGDIWLLDKKEIILDSSLSFINVPKLTIGNLETPIVEQIFIPSMKAGPSIRGAEKNLPLLFKLSEQFCLSLANNHIMDYGIIGLQNTKEKCDLANIITLGANQNSQKAEQAIFLTIDDIRVGILARCETQFGKSSPYKAGVATISATIYKQIENLKKEVDILILSIHGAAEMCPWPSPKWQDLLRSFIDAGVDIIHGHHAHVPQGYEEYHGGLIFYGLGNFLVDPSQWRDCQNSLWSLVIDFDLNSSNLPYSVKTFVIDRQDERVLLRLSSEQEYEKHLNYLQKCNQPLKDENLLTALWQESSIRMYYQYYGEWLHFLNKNSNSRNKYCDFLIKLKNQLKAKIKTYLYKSSTEDILNDKMMLWYHLFACESHCDAITTALGVISGELEDLRTKETFNLADKMMPWSIGAVPL